MLLNNVYDRFRINAPLMRGVSRTAPRLTVVGTALGMCCSAAFAQAAPVVSQPEVRTFAQPLLGQVSANSALSVIAAGNADRLSIAPTLNTVYDTNVLRRAQPKGADTGNLRVTPGVSILLRRSLGRFALNLSGTAGYDFNSRYRFLNRSRIDFAGGVKAPVGAICTANFTAAYDQYQFDLGDVTQTVGTTTRNQNYDLALGCSRKAGISPVGGVTYHTGTSGGISLYDYTQLSERVGLAYAQPSLGTVTLTAAASQLRRPNIVDTIGIDDSTNIRSLTLSLDRAVSQRVQLSVAVGFTEANPDRSGVSSFAGLSYNGRVNWNIVPLFSIAGSAARQVTSENGISATYVIREDYRLSADWQFSQASQVSLSASRVQRDFRGESLTATVQPVLSDRTSIVGAGYHYNTARWLRLGLGVTHQWRTADNRLYNYQSTIISGSIGTRF
ncbi:MAG: hypothetical protein JWO15_1728 [Sphingomonadales bacterium]|nr:hypothetical protein [Sphingomonadales bacterium]